MRKTNEKKINVSFIKYVKTLIDSKVSVEKGNLPELEKQYKEIVKLRFSNLERVCKRINRDGVKSKKAEKLKELNVSEKEFNKIGEELITISRENKLTGDYF